MGLALRMLRGAIRFPGRTKEKILEACKRDECSAAPGARLYPESRIVNGQKRRGAISIGDRSHILGELLVLPHGGSIEIGEGCYIGDGVRIWSADAIVIGNRVLISHGVNIHDNNSHSLSATSRHTHFAQIISSGHPAVLADVPHAPITIEDDAWIGFDSTILKGVRIGRGAVVGAASVVTKDVPAYAVVAGNPAKPIGAARP